MLGEQSLVAGCRDDDRLTTLMRCTSVHGLHVDAHTGRAAAQSLLSQRRRRRRGRLGAVVRQQQTLHGRVLDHDRHRQPAAGVSRQVVRRRAAHRVCAPMKCAAVLL